MSAKRDGVCNPVTNVSSPRVWGTLDFEFCSVAYVRFSPTGVGNILPQLRQNKQHKQDNNNCQFTRTLILVNQGVIKPKED